MTRRHLFSIFILCFLANGLSAISITRYLSGDSVDGRGLVCVNGTLVVKDDDTHSINCRHKMNEDLAGIIHC